MGTDVGQGGGTGVSRRFAVSGRVDVEVIWPVVVRYCRGRIGRVGGSFAVADGVAREVCSIAFGGLAEYRRRGGSFLAFVYGIAVREVGREHGGAVASAPGFSAELVGALSAEQREILVLRVVVGLSAEETADAVGMAPGAVRVAQHRALTELRRLVKAGGEKDR